MDSINTFFQELYKNFNDRQIEKVIGHMTDNVRWANGMEGGFVYGHEAVRAYWTRQFAMISSTVTPLEIDEQNETVTIKVHQLVHDLNGQLLADEVVFHHFHLQGNRIAEFEIGEKLEKQN